jgi:hypothetical protein
MGKSSEKENHSPRRFLFLEEKIRAGFGGIYIDKSANAEPVNSVLTTGNGQQTRTPMTSGTRFFRELASLLPPARLHQK